MFEEKFDSVPLHMSYLGGLKFATDDETGEDNGCVIQLLRTGKWNHPKYGPILITEKTFDDIIHNFEENVRGVDLAIDTEHKADKGAKGWIKEVFKDGAKLFAEVNWTPSGEKAIKDGEYKYISAEYSPLYTDTESGQNFRNVLVGAALTNRPFIKDMDPVLLSEDIMEDVLSDMELYSDDETVEDPQGNQRVNLFYDPETVQFSSVSGTPKAKYDEYREKLKDELNREKGKREALETRIKLMEVQGQVDTLIRKEGRVLPKYRKQVEELLLNLPGNQSKQVLDLLGSSSRKIHLSEIGTRVAPDEVLMRRTVPGDDNKLKQNISLVEEEVFHQLSEKGASDYKSYREAIKNVMKDRVIE